MSDNCGSGGGADDLLGLRVASIFVILVGSTGGALFPVLAKRSSWLRVPKGVFDFAKYFGSGVIIATAFIHLLASGLEELTPAPDSCIGEAWGIYPYALALCMLSIFLLFVVELIAFRWGTAKLASIGRTHDAHGHHDGSHAAHGPEPPFSPSKPVIPSDKEGSGSDTESGNAHTHGFADYNVLTQIIGVAILEFGVVLHSVLIGLTLAVSSEFKVLFVVLIFHQTFEGLGIGSRLANLELPPKYGWYRVGGAILYGVTTPLGIAVGLGVRSSYNPDSTTASIVSGVLDSFSAGILVYTGLVELLAHEFLFNKEMLSASNGRLAYALGFILKPCRPNLQLELKRLQVVAYDVIHLVPLFQTVKSIMPVEASEDKTQGKPTSTMPPGMVMGPDGKPCKVCTAFRNWKPNATNHTEADSNRESKQGGRSPALTPSKRASNAKETSVPYGLTTFSSLMSGGAATTSGSMKVQQDTETEARTSPTYRGDEPPPGCPPDVEQLGRATWTFLHTTAAYYPEKPTPTQRANMLMLLRSLPVLYPCGWCAEDFGKDITENPPDVSGRVGLSRWLCERHNAVNEKLGKDRFECSRVDERWKDGPADGSCD